MRDRFANRRDKLRHALKKPGVDSLLVTDFTNVTYLTGFTGDDSYLLVHPRGEVVVSDARYTTQLKEECPGLDLRIRRPGVSMVKALTKVLKAPGIGRLGVEADSMTLSLRDEIAAAMPKLELVSTTGIVEQLRQIKDREEVIAIRQAVGYAQQALEVVAQRAAAGEDGEAGGHRVGNGDAQPGGQAGVVSPRSLRWGLGRPCHMPGQPTGRSVRATLF